MPRLRCSVKLVVLVSPDLDALLEAGTVAAFDQLEAEINSKLGGLAYVDGDLEIESKIEP